MSWQFPHGFSPSSVPFQVDAASLDIHQETPEPLELYHLIAVQTLPAAELVAGPAGLASLAGLAPFAPAVQALDHQNLEAPAAAQVAAVQVAVQVAAQVAADHQDLE